MAFSSATELLAWLGQNLFFNPQQVEELQPWAALETNLHNFCKELLRRDWLTPYQINQIIKNGGETLVVGANRIHSRIGEGAMGQVFKAWNVRLGRMVAVKMLHPDHTVSAKAMDRFRREMQTASALDHPNIMLIRDADEVNKVPYLVMDYFDGIDLSRKMQQEGVQPIEQAVEYIRQAAMGLQHAYERGVVHRDIKPSNMLLVRAADGSPVIKLLDFGLAKFEREQEGQLPITQAGRLIGTVDFIAPEQAIDAHGADIRADVYSLGCTLLYLLTGKAPFPGNDQLEKLTARIQNDAPRLLSLRPDVPVGLDQVLAKMLARDPAHRFQTPLEVAVALSPYCRPIPAAMPMPAVVPMASPVAAPVIQALPVRAVVATPVAAVAVAEEPSADFPFAGGGGGGFHDDGGGVAVEVEDDLAEVQVLEEPTKSGFKTWIAVLGLLLVIGAGAAVYFLMIDPRPPVNVVLGTMTLQLDNPPDRIWKPGVRKPIIVKIDRQKFTGPVTLDLDNPPDGIRISNPVVVPADKNIEEIRMFAAFQTPPGPYKVRITATSPNSHPASVEYDFQLTD